MWPSYYDDCIKEWYNLRKEISTLSIDDALNLCNEWWSVAPLIEPYVFINQPEQWPDPWELFEGNGFCSLAKCIGIVYTLLLSDNKEITSLQIVEVEEDLYIVIVNELYVLNYGCDILEHIDIENKYTINCDFLKNNL